MAAMSDPKPPGAYASDIKMSGLVQLIVYDVGLPLLGFYGTRALGGSVMTGLVVATAVAAVRLVWQIVRHRKVDPFSAMMLLLVGGSLAISFFTGDPRFMLLRACIIGIVAGLGFIGSCLVKKPMSFAIAKRLAGKDEASQAGLDAGWAESAEFRRSFYVMSLVWGFGLLAETIVRILNIYVFIPNIDVVVAVNAAVHGGSVALMAAWNIWSIRRSRREALLLQFHSQDSRDELGEATDALLV